MLTVMRWCCVYARKTYPLIRKSWAVCEVASGGTACVKRSENVVVRL